mmetsp:Transcript_3997/g.5612  ORF Transcript_3997/g.5612 Transcript_3997/m.5612 type:complete len:520 (-) Transcript_3997:527-2086(-)
MCHPLRECSVHIRARKKEKQNFKDDSSPSISVHAATVNLEGRDWFGRGGLMGTPWIAFPSHLAGIATRIKVYGMSALWLVIAFQYFVWQLPLLLIMLIPGGESWYKRASSIFDKLARPAILATPYSWCGFRVHTNSYKVMCSMSAPDRERDALVMTNHCSRVDWLVGMLLGDVLRFQPRIGFVAEITTMLMPVFGWSRFLFGDIFLRRTFHRDARRINQNIQAFHKANVSRMIFVAPEGAIVDPGVSKDAIYVTQCQQFMYQQQRPILNFLLTPRYKGIQLLSSHCQDDATFSVTMSFVCRANSSSSTATKTFFRNSNSPNVLIHNNCVTGGELCTRALSDSERIVPDLHTVFRGGLHVFCHIHPMHIPQTATNDQVRDLLLDDYQRKDSLLAQFANHGTFDSVGKNKEETTCQDQNVKNSFYTLPIGHFRMNATLIIHSILSIRMLLFLFPNTNLYDIMNLVFASWLIVLLVHAVSHLYAEQISGASRESLLFETIFKSLIESYLGRLDHGSGTSSDH